MDLYTLLIIGHVIGTVLGVGGATMIEVQIGKALRDGKMDATDRAFLGSDFFVTRVGLVLSILTGIGFILLYAQNGTLFRTENGVFWAKMLMVVVIAVNAYLLHVHKIGLYWGSAFSFVTWWAVFFAGMFLTNGVKVYPQNHFISFGIVMTVYGLAVVTGAWLLHRIRERGKQQGDTPHTPPPPKPQNGEPIVQTADEALGRVPAHPPETHA